jgi:LacI family transcriptional regulator
LAFYQIPFNQDLVLACNYNSIEEGGIQILKLLNSGVEFNGLFAVEDLLALGAMEKLKKHDFKIPDDVAIMGFSNWKMAEVASPPLSSVEQNGYLMGEKVFQLFIKDKENKLEENSFQTEIIPTKIILRESTALKIKI